MNVLSIIPARSGSKGIPNKNILNIKNKPLISYSIKSSLESKIIDYTLVSTNCQKIKNIAEKYGAKVPFLRPKYLAGNKSNVLDTIIYSLKRIENIEKKTFNLIVVLQPTSPLRVQADISKSINLLNKFNFDSVISVTKYDGISPNILYKKKEKTLIPLLKTTFYQRQQYDDFFYRNGLIYVVNRDTLLKKKSLYGKEIGLIHTPEERSLNIDTHEDLLKLKRKLRYLP